MATDTVILASHFQNENCHPDGKIKIGIGPDSAWRWQRLENAKRLFGAARAAGVPIVHIRLAVPPAMDTVIQNNAMFRQWVEVGAWAEGSWGVEFIDGLGPDAGEAVVTNTRNNGFFDSDLQEILLGLRARRLICCGVSTAYTVESTVRHAAYIGYEVTVVSDACSTATVAQHEASLNAMRLLAEIATVDSIVAELSGRPAGAG